MLAVSISVAINVTAKDFLISPATDLKSVLKQVAEGDTMILRNGIWTDAQLKFEQLPGTANAGIQIRAETLGQVVFTGESEFSFSGQHVTVSGFVFRDVQNVSDVMSLRTHSERHAHQCRVTRCVFEQTSQSEQGVESRWLSVYGTHNRVDHCYFAGKKSPGTTFVVWVNNAPGEHRIDHNHFGPRPELGKNGGETIRIGTSEVSELSCRSIIEDNYFYQCDGEAELISNKSCENIYRHNLFVECSGTLTLRHGHRCIVDGNVFLGKKRNGTGGVRIIGQGHQVTNNYFEGLRGDAERAALCMMNGVPDGPLNEYAPVRDAVVANNTFIDCKVSMEIGVGVGKKQPAVPTDCRMANNLFLPDKWSIFRIHVEPKNFVWEGNKQQQGRELKDQPIRFDVADLRLNRASDGLLRPTHLDAIRSDVISTLAIDLDGYPRSEGGLAGCDDPTSPLYRWPSPATTGPKASQLADDASVQR